MKFISSIILAVALQMFSASKLFIADNNVALVNNKANSQANALAIQAGLFGNANANANSAATNNNKIRQY
jgi:hypothetical protein